MFLKVIVLYLLLPIRTEEPPKNRQLRKMKAFRNVDDFTKLNDKDSDETKR